MPEKTVFIGVLCTCAVVSRQLVLSVEDAMRHMKWIGAAGLVLAAQACVVRDSQPVNLGYYPSSGMQGGISASVGTPQPYAVQSMPPDPLYEQMTPSPGEGYVWIDGS